MNFDSLKLKKIAILGYGREGKSTLKFLKQIGCPNITILDKNKEIILEEGIHLQTGENYLNNLEIYDIIIKSPGISPYSKELLPYKDKFTSQTQLFFENYQGKIIAITGTKGKSTISTLAYLSLKEAGFSVKLVGNIGTPVLDEMNILDGETYDFIIYEMSSYMLENFVPKTFISVFNNIYNCHLDWHYGFENYKNAKINILKNTENALINWEFKDLENIKTLSQNTYFFGTQGNFTFSDNDFFIDNEKILSDESPLLLGEHNKKNICVALGVIYIASQDKDLSAKSLHKVITTFNGLPHRMENVGTYKGITFINDANATTPESTIAAIKTYAPKVETLFVGGFDCGFQYDEFENFLEDSSISNFVLFPDTGYKIFIQDINGQEEEKPFTIIRNGKTINILKTRSMKNAVQFSYTYTKPGYIVLLSCAAQSYSLWKNFEEKGQQFKDAIIKFSK